MLLDVISLSKLKHFLKLHLHMIMHMTSNPYPYGAYSITISAYPNTPLMTCAFLISGCTYMNCILQIKAGLNLIPRCLSFRGTPGCSFSSCSTVSLQGLCEEVRCHLSSWHIMYWQFILGHVVTHLEHLYNDILVAVRLWLCLQLLFRYSHHIH
jgi:hypothetical protein